MAAKNKVDLLGVVQKILDLDSKMRFAAIIDTKGNIREAIMKAGKIITIEQNPSKIKRAKENFQKAGVIDTIIIKEGLAMQILTELSLQKKYSNFFDFVLIDADKENVIEYFDLIFPMVAVGGVIVTDNMLYPERFRDDMKKFSDYLKENPKLHTITSPIGNGEEITIKIS